MTTNQAFVISGLILIFIAVFWWCWVMLKGK